MSRLLILLLSLPLAAQPITSPTPSPLLINAGGPAVNGFQADTCFTGGASWGPANDPAMLTVTDVYQTLRYGMNFTCNITIPATGSGLYSISILMLEPNKTGPGQRIFTVTVNGQQSAPLDLFQLTGGKLIPYEVDFLFFQVERQITISFHSSVGNAVVSAIIVRGGPQPVTTGSLGMGLGGWLVALLNMPGVPTMAAVAIGQCGAGTVDPATAAFFEAILCYDPPSQSALIKFYDSSGNLLSKPL